MFRKTMDYCEAGDNVGILLRGIKREDIERGQVICKPGSVTPHKKFTGEIYVLTKEEGGRHTPFFAGYRPQFYFRTTDITGDIQELTDSNGTKVEMAMPGDHVTVTCELIHEIAMEQAHPRDRHGAGRQVRHPRGRPHRRRRPYLHHHRVELDRLAPDGPGTARAGSFLRLEASFFSALCIL